MRLCNRKAPDNKFQPDRKRRCPEQRHQDKVKESGSAGLTPLRTVLVSNYRLNFTKLA
jgi:hypothetical protein